MNFRKGQKVRWYDPAMSDYFDAGYGALDIINRVFVVHEVDNRNGIAYIIEDGGGSEAEVYTDELEPI